MNTFLCKQSQQRNLMSHTNNTRPILAAIKENVDSINDVISETNFYKFQMSMVTLLITTSISKYLKPNSFRKIEINISLRKFLKTTCITLLQTN